MIVIVDNISVISDPFRTYFCQAIPSTDSDDLLEMKER